MGGQGSGHPDPSNQEKKAVMSSDSRKSLPSRAGLYLLEKELTAPATITVLPVAPLAESLPVAA